MTLAEIHELYEYNAWANHRVLESCVPLTTEQFTRPLGSSFSSLRDTLVHILGAEWIWLERWMGRSPEALPSPEKFPDLASVRVGWEPVEFMLMVIVAGLREDEIQQEIDYINLQGERFAYPLRAMLVHLVNHGSYHRGQVAAMLRQLGAQPLPTDYLVFLDALARVGK
jgi:uncharacterized damage-inducible protein DinB